MTRLDQILEDFPQDNEEIRNNRVLTILGGSYQYGTYVETQSDLDIVVIHTANYGHLFKVETDENNHNCQFETTVEFNGVDTKVDARYISLDVFAKKLYKGDMNAIEYVNSPFNWPKHMRYTVNGTINHVVALTFKHIFLRSFSPAIKWKLLKSCLGFINNLKETGSTKRQRIKEQINPNNLVRIASLYYLITHEFYPLNPQQACDEMQIELYDTASPRYHNLDNMTVKMESKKAELERDYDEQELTEGFWNKFMYEKVTEYFYTETLLRNEYI